MNKNKFIIDEIVHQNKDYQSGVLINFQHGDILSEGELKMECVTATDKNASDIKNKNIGIVINKDNVYTGIIGENDSTNLVNTYIGIKNKTTNKMKIIELKECSMISQCYELNNEKKSQLQINDARKILLKTYGGKGASRAVDRNERMKINIDIIKSQLDESMKVSTNLLNPKWDKFNQSQLENEQFLQSILPPINLEAKQLHEVYKLEDLIDEILLKRLNEEANQILITKPENLPMESQFLRDVIVGILTSKDSTKMENLTKIKVCVYLDGLVNFLKVLKEKSTRKSTIAFSKISEKVENDIRAKFANPINLKIISSNLTLRKVYYYIIVLILLISDKYTTNADNIIQLTNLSKGVLNKYTNAIKATYKSGSNTVALQLPSKIRPLKLFVRNKSQR